MRRVAFTLFAAALVFTLVMAWLPHPPEIPGNPGDKVEHVAAFLTLALLAAWSLPEAPLARIGERLSFLGAVIELVQNIPALHRDCDIVDWAADTLAVIAMLALVALVRLYRARRAELQPDPAG